MISKAIRNQVRKRAGERCEYCHKPDALSVHPHHVDHIISQKHEGSNELDNLAWACFQCNLCKGTDIAAVDRETQELVPLYNPRNQEWDQHFKLDDTLIKGITPIGRVTVRLLQINHPDQVETRRWLISENLW